MDSGLDTSLNDAADTAHSLYFMELIQNPLAVQGQRLEGWMYLGWNKRDEITDTVKDIVMMAGIVDMATIAGVGLLVCLR